MRDSSFWLPAIYQLEGVLGSCPRINYSDGCILIRVTSAGRSAGPNREHVVDEPLLAYLVHLGIAHDACRLQHLVRRLEDALQVRWITLHERDLFCQRFEFNSPGDRVVGAGDLEEAIESPRDRRREPLIERR